jgi:hypothetical protein
MMMTKLPALMMTTNLMTLMMILGLTLMMVVLLTTVEEEKEMIEEMRKIYIADDGTEFSTMEDCQEYERSKGTGLEGQIFLYNGDFKLVNPFDSTPDEIYYVNILTEEASEWFQAWCDDYSATSPWTMGMRDPIEEHTGVFMYDEDKDWVHLETEVARLHNIMDKVKGC